MGSINRYSCVYLGRAHLGRVRLWVTQLVLGLLPSLLLGLLVFLLNLPTYAAQVVAVGKNQVKIALEGDLVQLNSRYYLTSTEGKKIAVVRITKSDEKYALALVEKGKPRKGLLVLIDSPVSPKKEATPHDQEKHEGETTREVTKGLRDSWGILVAYSMNTMNAKKTANSVSDTTNMTGSSFGLNGFYDYVFSKEMSLRFLGAYEQLSAAGSISSSVGCNNSTNCDVNISYLSAYGHIKYYLSTGSTRTYGGLGFGLMFPVSKSSSALQTDKISMNQVANIALGVDIMMGGKNYLPIIFEYNYFPPSDTVGATMMFLKTGWAFNL